MDDGRPDLLTLMGECHRTKVLHPKALGLGSTREQKEIRDSTVRQESGIGMENMALETCYLPMGRPPMSDDAMALFPCDVIAVCYTRLVLADSPTKRTRY